jgi:serine/threonine protein kinase/Tol biopolymer transport system component
MPAEHWQSATEIFDAVVERPPHERSGLLEERCAGDEVLRRKIELLLRYHDKTDGFIERPAFEVAPELLLDDADALIGRKLGHYRIESVLGAGGMGVVYLAHDEQLGRKVGLKLLPPSLVANEGQLDRLKREARTASALNHPNIVTIHEIGQVDGTHYIATEFVEGRTLRAALSGGRINLHEALDIAVQVASALAAAHQIGVVHRDIKPENIMLRPDGFAKVLDFGIAKFTEQHATADQHDPTAVLQTAPGLVLGTARYMSPEQTRGQSVDARSDIWSLGVVLYEMVTGIQPFAGETPSDCIASILKTEPPPLAFKAPELPLRLEEIVQKALRKEREERYQSAAEMLADLRQVSAEAEGVTAHGIRRHRTLFERMSSARPRQAVSGTGYRVGETKRYKLNLITALLAFVVTAAGIGFAIYRLREQRTADKPFEKMTLTKLTTHGRVVSSAAISPDGRHVAYVMKEDGQESLWVKQVDGPGGGQIVPPSANVGFRGLTFSPEGDYIYYARGASDAFDVYHAPIVGGAERKVIPNVGGEGAIAPFTFSPDGGRIAFLRVYLSQEEQALMVVNRDGTGERKLAARKIPNFFDAIAWSPEGEVIACAAENLDAGNRYSTVVEVRVQDGAEKPLVSQRWDYIGQVVWLRDGKGLVVAVREKPQGQQQLWYISYPDGELRRITNDLDSYLSVSLTADSKTLIAVQNELDLNVWVAPEGVASRAKRITSGRADGRHRLSWTPDGKLVYASPIMGVGLNIMRTEADGTDQRSLTADGHSNYAPTVSADGRYVVFVSFRNGSRNLWRMAADGSNLKQLTDGGNPFWPQVSPDSKWVIYTVFTTPVPTTWKVSIEGSEPVQVTDAYTWAPAISPDGKLIACYFKDVVEEPMKIGIIPMEGGRPKQISGDLLSTEHGRPPRWMPDGQAVAYPETHDGVANLWALPVKGGQPVQLTDFKSLFIFSFDWSRDGKQLALARGTQAGDVVLIRDFR